MITAKLDVVWLSLKEGTPARGYWDQTLLERLLANANHHESVEDLTGAIVVIPGAYQGEYIDQINAELQKLEWVLVILTSDEENKFPANQLKHDNMVIFSNYPNHKYEVVSRWLPIGPAKEPNAWIADERKGWFFSGQITHPGREAYAKTLRHRNDGRLIETDGFGQGLDWEEYTEALSRAIVVPAPSGPCTPDSFRLYEAIEHGAVPIPHDVNFWNMLFKDPPFPVLENYDQLDGYMNDTLEKYPKLNNRVQAWWLQEQWRIEHAIFEAIKKMTGFYPADPEVITVIIPVSPIKSHPSMSILEETVYSVRHHLPDARIIITFDGVRREQKHRTDDYEEFIRRVLYRCNNDWPRVLPLIFEKHTHQVGMAREALQWVQTSLIMYVEQDTPLVTDMDIDWKLVKNELFDGHGDVVRFHFESVIPEAHEHMILGRTGQFIKTCQWSQRPHVSTTAYYRRILENHFSENAKSFIEDKMHSVAHEAYLKDNEMGWLQHKILIYAPEGDTYKRSYHTDGRAGEDKYDNKQVF